MSAEDHWAHVLEGFDDEEILQLHRDVSRRAAAIYRDRNRHKHAAGVAAAREKQRAGHTLYLVRRDQAAS